MNVSHGYVQLAQKMFVSSASAEHALGQAGRTRDGRIFYYAKMGAVDSVAGKVYQSAVTVPGHQSLANNTTSALSVGATSITVTCASSVAVNFYSEGYACIASSAGQGYQYFIERHAAVSTGANGQFFFYAEDTVQVALLPASVITLMQNPYSGVVVVPATRATGVIVGVSPYIITAGQYGWLATWGPTATLSNDAGILGQWVNGIAASCGRVAGMSSPAVTACYIVGQPVGVLMQTGVQGQFIMVDLKIRP